MTHSSVESQLRLYGQDLYERCADHLLTKEDLEPAPSSLPKAAFAIVLALFVVGVAAGLLRPWSDGASGPPAVAPKSGVAPEGDVTDTAPSPGAPEIVDPRAVTVDKATVRGWIEESERYYGVSVGDLCPAEMTPGSGLVMGLSVMEPVGFGSCRVVAFAPLQPGAREEGYLVMGDYDENGNLLDESSPNMPRVDWSSPVYGQRDDGSPGMIGTQTCITDSNGGRYCSGQVSPNS
jgi:hypothetical protein